MSILHFTPRPRTAPVEDRASHVQELHAIVLKLGDVELFVIAEAVRGFAIRQGYGGVAADLPAVLAGLNQGSLEHACATVLSFAEAAQALTSIARAALESRDQ